MAQFRITNDPPGSPYFKVELVDGEPSADEQALSARIGEFLATVPHSDPVPAALSKILGEAQALAKRGLQDNDAKGALVEWEKLDASLKQAAQLGSRGNAAGNVGTGTNAVIA